MVCRTVACKGLVSSREQVRTNTASGADVSAATIYDAFLTVARIWLVAFVIYLS